MPTIVRPSFPSWVCSVARQLRSVCLIACALVLCWASVSNLHAADGGTWVVPTGFQDPEYKWVTEPAAYDESTATYAADQSNRAGDGPWLELAYPSGVTTDRVQMVADFGFNIVDGIALEARIGGVWTPIYAGVIPNDVATVIEFPGVTTTAFRFRFHYVVNGYYFWLYDFRAYQLPAAMSPPQVTTLAASSVTTVTAVLHGLLASDGGQPCTVRFQYKPVGAPDYISSPWYGGITSGQGSNEVLSSVSGLQTGVEYRFRVQAENSAGTATGGELSFMPLAVVPGTVGWVSASGVIPSGAWTDPVRAMDDDVITAARCYHPLWTPVTSPSIEFDLPAITTDFLRIMAGKNVYIAGVTIQVQQTAGGVWTPLTTIGSLQDRAWLYAPLPATAAYAKARVTFTTTTTGVGTAWELHELQVRVPDSTTAQVSFAAGADQAVSARGRYTLPLTVTSSSLSPVPVLVTVSPQSQLRYGRDYTIVGAQGSPLQITVPPGDEHPVIQVDLKAYDVGSPVDIEVGLWSAAQVTVVQPATARLSIAPYSTPIPQPPVITVTPPGGAYAGPVHVVVSVNAPNAPLYYTTDGSAPDITKTTISGPITISANTRLRVMSFGGTLYNNMPIGWQATADETYAFLAQVRDPVFAPDGGTFPVPTLISMSCSTVGAAIRYTLDGSTPTEMSTLYTAPVLISTTRTLQARAFLDGLVMSGITTRAVIIADQPPQIVDYPNATGDGPVRTLSVGGADDLPESTLTYTWSQVDGPGTVVFGPENGSNAGKATLVLLPVAGRYRLRVDVRDAAGHTTSGVCLVDLPSSWPADPVIQPATEVHSAEFDAALTSSSAGAVVRYRTDGGTVSLADAAGAVVHVDRGMTISARAFAHIEFQGVSYDFQSGQVAQAYQMRLAAPVFTPAGGHALPIVVAVTGAPGSTVRMTTDGSEPTDASPVAPASFTVTETSTLRARAYRTGWLRSPIAEATFTATPSPTTTYVYDAANRLTDRIYADGKRDTFGYDAAGRLTSATSQRYDNTVARSYDDAGRLEEERLTMDGRTDTVGSTYDAANRPTGLTYPDGSQVQRTYTPRSQLESVTWNGAPVASRTYDAGGRLETTTYGDQVRTESRTYHAGSNMVASIAVPGVTDFSYDYDSVWRKSAERDLTDTSRSQHFRYDDASRLTEWRQGATYPAPASTRTWDLSLVGDWKHTTVDGVTESREHTPVHEIANINGQQLQHDVRGNLSRGLPYADGSEARFAWDVENRLASATAADVDWGATGTATYRYDALGRRVQKTVWGETTTYVHAGAQVIQRTTVPQVLPEAAADDDGELANGIPPGASYLGGGGILADAQQRVNFQPERSAIPEGFVADKGKARDERSNGLTYGWAAAQAGQVERRAYPLPQFDTHIRMQVDGQSSPGTWSMALPNGTYAVVVVMGDPTTRNQTNDVSVNGIACPDPSPATTEIEYRKGDFDGYIENITVSDGFLTIAAQATAFDAKLCFVEIGPEGVLATQAERDRLAAVIEAANNQTAKNKPVSQEVASYVYGSYVDEVVAYTQTVAGLTKRYYPHYNSLYSVAALTDTSGAVVERYTYDAYGKQKITDASGNVTRAKSSVGWDRGFTGYITDNETGLAYARNRMYSPSLGRFASRDPVRYRLNKSTNFPAPGPGDGYLEGYSLYESYFVPNGTDARGLWGAGSGGTSNDRRDWGHSDFPGHDIFNYNAEDNDLLTNPILATPLHFQELAESESQLQEALSACAKRGFERRMHRMQDYYAHVVTGYQAYGGQGTWGHGLNKEPDDATRDPGRFDEAAKKSQEWVDKWKECCCLVGDEWKPKNPRPAHCGAAPPAWPRLPNRGGHARRYWK